MILNGLGLSNRVLYLTSRFFKEKPISILLNADIQSTDLIEHTLGHTLDEIYLDRGFCSVSNIKEMYQSKRSFIQPLSYSLKKAKDLVSKHKFDICTSKNAFMCNKEVLYHTQDEIEFEKIKLATHVFF